MKRTEKKPRQLHRLPPRKIVVVGASAGGIPPICKLLSLLPDDFPYPIFVVVHIGRLPSLLPQVLNNCGSLQATHPREGELIRAGRIYVAPPNQHLLVRDGVIGLSHGPRENRSRPAVDTLFRSAARAFRENVIGILFSGELDDGVAGLFAIRARGGLTIAQDPAEAVAPSMPRTAVHSGNVDHVLPITKIAALLTNLSQNNRMKTQNKKGAIRSGRRSSLEPEDVEGNPIPMACPDCNGPLFEVTEGETVKFHCIVGHSYSPLSLSDAHADALERAIWVAIRTLKEGLTLHRALSDKHKTSSEKELVQRLGEDAERIEKDIKLLEEIQKHI